MNSTFVIFATLTAVTLGIVAVGTDGREVCVKQTPETAGRDVGYELIDILRREAWVTTDWTVDAYAKFSPGITAPHWIKNDPRQGYAARTAFLRSPGCAADGEFTFQTMHGRRFIHVADLTGLRGDELTGGALVEASVNKHHRLAYDAGQTVSFLLSPSGERFVRVNRPIDASHDAQSVPMGWSLREMTLTDPWHADLIGDVAVLRLENGVSYQGPFGELPPVGAQDAIQTSELADD